MGLKGQSTQTNLWMQATNSMSLYITRLFKSSPLEIDIANSVTLRSTRHSVIAVSALCQPLVMRSILFPSLG
jgi:hypothetical protein